MSENRPFYKDYRLIIAILGFFWITLEAIAGAFGAPILSTENITRAAIFWGSAVPLIYALRNVPAARVFFAIIYIPICMLCIGAGVSNRPFWGYENIREVGLFILIVFPLLYVLNEMRNGL